MTPDLVKTLSDLSCGNNPMIYGSICWMRMRHPDSLAFLQLSCARCYSRHRI